MSCHADPLVKPTPAVAAAVLHQAKVLMVRRRNPPNAGKLALPGGRVEPGEPLFQTALRELREETSVIAEAERVITAIDQFHRDEAGQLLGHFVIVVVACRWLGGIAVAGEDASEVCWLSATQVRDDPDLCDSARRVALTLLDR